MCVLVVEFKRRRGDTKCSVHSNEVIKLKWKFAFRSLVDPIHTQKPKAKKIRGEGKGMIKEIKKSVQTVKRAQINSNEYQCAYQNR